MRVQGTNGRPAPQNALQIPVRNDTLGVEGHSRGMPGFDGVRDLKGVQVCHGTALRVI
jgi:hypothetical protein